MTLTPDEVEAFINDWLTPRGFASYMHHNYPMNQLQFDISHRLVPNKRVELSVSMQMLVSIPDPIIIKTALYKDLISRVGELTDNILLTVGNNILPQHVVYAVDPVWEPPQGPNVKDKELIDLHTSYFNSEGLQCHFTEILIGDNCDPYSLTISSKFRQYTYSGVLHEICLEAVVDVAKGKYDE